MDVDQVASGKLPQDEQAKMPFVEKYRPDSLEEIISHVDIVHTSKLQLGQEPKVKTHPNHSFLCKSPQVYRR